MMPKNPQLIDRVVAMVIRKEREGIFGQGAMYSFQLLFLLFLLLLSSCTPPLAVRPSPFELAAGTPQLPHSQQDEAQVVTPPLPQVTSAPATAFALGQEALRKQQYEQAVLWLEQAVQREAGNAHYHHWLGRAYGHHARQADTGEQFFLARKVRQHLEKAVALDPENLPARFDLIEYYLQAPSLLGGSHEKARQQAAEIAKRDTRQGSLAWQKCQQAEMHVPLFEITDVGY